MEAMPNLHNIKRWTRPSRSGSIYRRSFHSTFLWRNFGETHVNRQVKIKRNVSCQVADFCPARLHSCTSCKTMLGNKFRVLSSNARRWLSTSWTFNVTYKIWMIQGVRARKRMKVYRDHQKNSLGAENRSSHQQSWKQDEINKEGSSVDNLLWR